MDDYRLKGSLSKRFKSGLEKLGLSEEDVRENYQYVGGETGEHLQFFKACYPDRPLPTHQDVCICGHRCSMNCFISNGETFLSVGESCASKWLPQKVCKDCGSKTRNRKDMLCSKCRTKFTRVFEPVTLSFK